MIYDRSVDCEGLVANLFLSLFLSLFLVILLFVALMDFLFLQTHLQVVSWRLGRAERQTYYCPDRATNHLSL
jgi:hypothetical protein